MKESKRRSKKRNRGRIEKVKKKVNTLMKAKYVNK